MDSHTTTRQVHVRAFGVLRGEHPANIGNRVFLQPFNLGAQGAGKVIGVGNRNVAFARHQTAQLVGITTLGITGKVVDHTLCPGLGFFFTKVLDHRGQQRLGIDGCGRPVAHLTLVGRIGQIQIGLRRVRHTGLVIKDDPRALRETEPFVVGILQVTRNAFFQDVAVHGLQHARILGTLQARGVHCQQHIRGRVLPLGLHPRDQLISVAFDAVDGDARGLGKVGIEPLVGVVVTRGIKVQLAIGIGRKCHQRGKGESQRGGETHGGNSCCGKF